MVIHHGHQMLVLKKFNFENPDMVDSCHFEKKLSVITVMSVNCLTDVG